MSSLQNLVTTEILSATSNDLHVNWWRRRRIGLFRAKMQTQLHARQLQFQCYEAASQPHSLTSACLSIFSRAVGPRARGQGWGRQFMCSLPRNNGCFSVRFCKVHRLFLLKCRIAQALSKIVESSNKSYINVLFLTNLLGKKTAPWKQ